MPDDQDPQAPPATPAPPPPPSAGTPPQTFTQEQLEQLVAGRVARAQKDASKALLDEFGFASKAEADRFIKETREQHKAQMTEAERLAAEAQEAKTAAERERSEIARERHQTAVERALIVAGAPVDKAARMVTMVTVDQGADVAAITAAVEATKGDFPALFGSNASPKSPGSEPHGGGPPGSRTPQNDTWEAGRKRAEAMKAARATQGFTP